MEPMRPASYHEIDEMIMSELAGRSAELARAHDDEVAIEVVASESIDDLEQIRTLKFERAPYDREEIGTATILGTGFPKIPFARGAGASFTGLWFHPSDDTLMRLEDVVSRPRTIPAWIAVVVMLGAITLGAAIWFI